MSIATSYPRRTLRSFRSLMWLQIAVACGPSPASGAPICRLRSPDLNGFGIDAVGQPSRSRCKRTLRSYGPQVCLRAAFLQTLRSSRPQDCSGVAFLQTLRSYGPQVCLRTAFLQTLRSSRPQRFSGRIWRSCPIEVDAASPSVG